MRWDQSNGSWYLDVYMEMGSGDREGDGDRHATAASSPITGRFIEFAVVISSLVRSPWDAADYGLAGWI